MQIKSLRIKSYRSWRIDDNTGAAALGRLKQLEWVATLREEGCSEATALAVTGWSRATYYRRLKRYREGGLKGLESGSRAPRGRRVCQWTKQQEQQVLHLRQRYPLWGKRKLWRVLVRERGWTLSETNLLGADWDVLRTPTGGTPGRAYINTVGRIVARLVRLGRVKPVAFYYGRVKPKRWRRFIHHAKRWRYGMKARVPGELMQAVSMSISFTEGELVKEFKATCPVSKRSGLQVYRRATSGNARRFLEVLRNEAPFPIRSIQVDGGSEFWDEFEQACQDLGIPLYVLPPKKPEYNGCVERANGTSRYEFYPFYEGPLTVEAINRKLAEYQDYYNTYRPHDGIGLLTPMEYYQQITQSARESHMY